MGYQTILPAPGERQVFEGRFGVCQVHLFNSNVALDIAPTVLTGVQGIPGGAVTFGRSKEIFQIGAGDRSLQIMRSKSGDASFTINNGEVPHLLSAILGKTFSTAGQAINLNFPKHETFALEFVARAEDEETHLMSLLFPMVRLMPAAFDVNLDDSVVTVPAKYKYLEPLILPPYGVTFMDKFTTNGTADDFVLSYDPINVVDTSLDHNKEGWVLDNIVAVLHKPTGGEVWTLQKAGLSYTSGTKTLTFETAPAAGQLAVIAVQDVTPAS